MADLSKMSGVQLRLELAEAEYEHAKTWKGIFGKEDRINAITRELVRKGCF